MRKKIRLLIALFTLEQAAMAQSLNSGEQLKQKESFPKMPPKTALAKVDAAATPYWVDAKVIMMPTGAIPARMDVWTVTVLT